VRGGGVGWVAVYPSQDGLDERILRKEEEVYKKVYGYELQMAFF